MGFTILGVYVNVIASPGDGLLIPKLQPKKFDVSWIVTLNYALNSFQDLTPWTKRDAELSSA
jgi:hypothetical protein